MRNFLSHESLHLCVSCVGGSNYKWKFSPSIIMRDHAHERACLKHTTQHTSLASSLSLSLPSLNGGGANEEKFFLLLMSSNTHKHVGEKNCIESHQRSKIGPIGWKKRNSFICEIAFFFLPFVSSLSHLLSLMNVCAIN